MKLLKGLLTLVLAATVSLSAAAGDIFRFGPRIGTEVSSMKLNSDVFNADNRAGFTGGLMMEVNVPLINLGFDLSVMYVHRVNANSLKNGISDTNPDQLEMLGNDNYRKRDYIEIPLNVKYKFGLPVVGKIVSPYIFTGPSFAFLASKKAINAAYENKSFDVSWNVGAGVQLFNHLQVGASYGFGITKTVSKISNLSQGATIDGKNNYWTITAAWLF